MNPTLARSDSKLDFLNSLHSMQGEVLLSSSILIEVFCYYSSILAGWHKRRRSKSRYGTDAGFRQVTYMKGEKVVLKV